MDGRFTRRGLLVGSAATIGSGVLAGRAQSQAPELLICTWSGSFLAAQRAHYFDPFEKETGIRVLATGTPSVARIKAMVEAGNVEWDLAQVSLLEMIAAQRDNLLEKIDYTDFPKQELDAILPEAIKSHGIGTQIIASAIAYNRNAFKGNSHPASWAEVWDVAKFPGPRTLQAMDFGTRPLEAPLLADGVPASNLYPLDIDRAFRSLDRLRPDVVKWGGRGVQLHDLIATGEAVVGQASSGRVIAMKEQGAPIDFDFNQALLFTDVWVIPRGAKNYKSALRFLQFASGARPQAAFSAAYPNGPVNRGAYAHLTPEQAARLPTAPGVLEKAVIVDADWWAADESGGKPNIDLVAERWRRWVR